MTAPNPDCVDPASDIINEVMNVVRAVYAVDSECPPLECDSTPTVRFFTWSGAPLAAWDAHTINGESCGQPFLWVRLDNRYRSTSFPEETIEDGTCKGQRVISLEVGVARCSTMEAEVSWEVMAREAEVGLDDSWRIEKILCIATQLLGRQSFQVATETIVPFGPEGGIAAWSGMLRVGF